MEIGWGWQNIRRSRRGGW